MIHQLLEQVYYNDTKLDLEIRQTVVDQVAPALNKLVMGTAAEIASRYYNTRVYEDIIAEVICKCLADMFSLSDNDQEAVLRPNWITPEVFADYLLPPKPKTEPATKIAVKTRIDVPLEAVQ